MSGLCYHRFWARLYVRWLEAFSKRWQSVMKRINTHTIPHDPTYDTWNSNTIGVKILISSRSECGCLSIGTHRASGVCLSVQIHQSCIYERAAYFQFYSDFNQSGIRRRRISFPISVKLLLRELWFHRTKMDFMDWKRGIKIDSTYNKLRILRTPLHTCSQKTVVLSKCRRSTVLFRSINHVHNRNADQYQGADWGRVDDRRLV